MNIEEIKRKVDEALADKQEFADLAFTLIPELIAEIEARNLRLSEAEDLLSEAHDLLDDVHCYETEVYRGISVYFNGEEDE